MESNNNIIQTIILVKHAPDVASIARKRIYLRDGQKASKLYPIEALRF